MSKTKASQANPVLSPRLPVLVNAEQLISLRLEALLVYEPYLDSPDKVYELHEMRIAAKRLRYTMEIFQDVYTLYTAVGTEFAQALKVVKGLQEHLGALHDADVLVPQLLEHMTRLLQSGYGPQKVPVAQIPNAVFEVPTEDKQHKKAVPQSVALIQQMEKLPIAGVHRVDYAGCEGLLSLCMRTRDERDLRYTQLLKEWQQIQKKQVFARLRTLLASAVLSGEREIVKTETVENSRSPDTDASVPSASVPSASDTGSPDGLSADPIASDSSLSDDVSSASSDSDNSGAAKISSLIEPGPSNIENAENVTTRQNSQIQRAPGEPGHIAAGRRRDVSRTETGVARTRKKADPDKSPQTRATPPGTPAVQRDAGAGDIQPISRRVADTRGKRYSEPGSDSGTGTGESGSG